MVKPEAQQRQVVRITAVLAFLSDFPICLRQNKSNTLEIFLPAANLSVVLQCLDVISIDRRLELVLQKPMHLKVKDTTL